MVADDRPGISGGAVALTGRKARNSTMVIPMLRTDRAASRILESAIEPGTGAYTDLWTWTLRQGDFVVGVGHSCSRDDAAAAAAQAAASLKLVEIVAA
jgi:hypothetical protein